MNDTTFRPGRRADSYTIFTVFEETLADLSHRLGSTTLTSWSDPEALARMWAERRSMYEHMAYTAEQFWLAERAGQVIGFARSILREGYRELTELFVRPNEQSGGVGRELLARAFPLEGVTHRIIIASTDIRAQALYLKMGVYPRCPIYYFWRLPELTTLPTDLKIEPVTSSPEHLEKLGTVDKIVLGYRREPDHTWLLTNRQGYLYYRAGQPVGYGYYGPKNGPFALLNAGDFPAVLTHAESEAVAQGREHFGLEVPMVNKIAVDYLLGRGFRMDSFFALFMSDVPLGQLENYIVTSPPFFL